MVSDAALKLEMIGHSGDLTGADDAFRTLEDEVERLITTLKQMLEVKNASPNS